MSVESAADADTLPDHTTERECGDWRMRVRDGESIRSIANSARWSYQTVRHHVLDHDSCTHDHDVPSVKPSRRNGPGVHAHPDEPQAERVRDVLGELLAANYGSTLYVSVARLKDHGLDGKIRDQRIGATLQMFADEGDTSGRFAIRRWNDDDANVRRWVVERAEESDAA